MARVLLCCLERFLVDKTWGHCAEDCVLLCVWAQSEGAAYVLSCEVGPGEAIVQQGRPLAYVYRERLIA